MNLVYIKWRDSYGITSEWEYIKGLKPQPSISCHSVGFVTEETKHYITLAQSVGDKQVCGRITIPLCSILIKRNIKGYKIKTD